MRLEIGYTGGAQISLESHLWSAARSESVEYVDLIVDGAVYRVMGHSIYWLRTEDDKVFVGGGDVVNKVPKDHIVTIEEVHHSRGRFYRRVLDSMPDLQHEQVKLGWWS